MIKMYADKPAYADQEDAMRVWTVEKSRIGVPMCRHRTFAGRGTRLPMSCGHQQCRCGVWDVQNRVLKSMWPLPDPKEFRVNNDAAHLRHQLNERKEKPAKTVKYFEVYKERRRMLSIMREDSCSYDLDERREEPDEKTDHFAPVPERHQRSTTPGDRDSNLGPSEISEKRDGSSSENGYHDNRRQQQRQQQQQPKDTTNSLEHGSEKTIRNRSKERSRTDSIDECIASGQPLPVGKVQDVLLGDVIWDEDDENTFFMADMFKDVDSTRRERLYRGTFLKPSE